MRNRWCNKLAKKDWGRITRTRIALRRQLGRNPTFEEVDAAIKGDQKFGYITADDIAQAFDNGEEVCTSRPLPCLAHMFNQQLAVWTMKCVDYSEQFQRDLARQITGWAPPPPQSKSKTRAAKKTTSTLRGGNCKPKRAPTVESEDESD
jgi:hypothetical protein